MQGLCRHTMKTRTIFVLTLLILILYGVFFFSFYALDLFKVQHAYAAERINLDLKDLTDQMKDEKNDAASMLYSVRALFNAQKSKLSTKEGQQQLIKFLSEQMQNHSNQFATYFALEEPLAQALVNKKGWTLASYKDIRYKNTNSYSDPKNRITQEYFDPSYRRHQGEVWYQVAKHSQQVEFSNIYFDKNYLKEWMFSAGLGIYEDGVFQGMVGVDILLDSFFADVEKKNLNGTGGFFLADKKTGVVLSKITMPNFLFGKHEKRQQISLLNFSWWSEALDKGLDYKLVEDELGNDYRLSSYTTDDSPWVLVAFQDQRLALMPLYKKVINFAAISVLLIIFTLLKQLSSTILQLNENTKALKLSENRFNVVFDQAFEFMALVDINGNLEEVNNAVQTSASIKKETILHQPIWDGPWWQHSTEIKNKVKNAVLKAIEGKGSVQELTYKNYTGEIRYLSFSVSPIRNEDGAVEFLFSTARDITKQKEIQLSLREAMEMAELSNIAKSEFLANMSHEIRTPMNGVLGMLQFLQESKLSDEQQSQVEVAAKSAQSLLRIIDDILDISKIEAGKMSIKMAPFSLRESVEGVIALMKYKAEDKGLTLHLNFSDVDSDVIGDAGRIEQVLKNLLGNAIKFTEEGSITVTVNLQEKNHHYYELVCSVEDTGIGIELDKQDILFKSFTQIDPSSSRHYEGTGLGLHISKQLCSLMGGSLDVASTPGKGSTFFFRLLLQRQHSSDESVLTNTQTKTLPLYQWPDNSKVLLVEDNEVNQLVAKKMLENLGLQCDVVDSGLLALSALKESDELYLAVFMDCQMPKMDGYEATERIRNGEAGERYSSIPIVALTAHAMEGDRERCLIAGMNDYVVKPIEQKALKDALIQVLTDKNQGEI